MEIKLSNSSDITANPNGVELLIAPGATRGRIDEAPPQPWRG